MTVKSLAEGLGSYRSWACDPHPRVGFGMPFFDRITNGGLALSEIAMFMAFSSVGKTTFGLNVVRNNYELPVLLMSGEMSWRQVAPRLWAMEYGQPTTDLEKMVTDGNPKVDGTFQWLQDRYRFLVCDDTPGVTFRQADEAMESAEERLGHKPQLVIWDYLELIGGGGLAGKVEQIDRAAVKLRDWTRKHDTRSIVLHQISGQQGHEPLNLASGRYGGYQPMDYVVGAYAPRLEPGISHERFEQVKEEVYFQVLKSRAGTTKPVGQRYRLSGTSMRISEWHEHAHAGAAPQFSAQLLMPIGDPLPLASPIQGAS